MARARPRLSFLRVTDPRGKGFCLAGWFIALRGWGRIGLSGETAQAADLQQNGGQ